MKRILFVAAAAAFALFSVPANAHHFTIIGGLCFNPATNPMMGIPLTNPHCASVPDTPPPDGGGNGGDKPKKRHGKKSDTRAGKMIVGCIMGSAFGAITASVRKASAMGNPPRWRSQAEHERIVASGYEKQFEMTSDEASTALALCGAGSFALHWPRR